MKLSFYLTIFLTTAIPLKIQKHDIYIKDDLFDNNDSQDIKNISGDVIETIDLSDDIEIPSNNEVVTDAIPQDLEKISKQRPKGNLKKTNKKASKWLKKTGYLGTDDLETIN